MRFISTPEILERFLRIEQEILQIDCSVQSELSTTNGGHAGEGTKNCDLEILIYINLYFSMMNFFSPSINFGTHIVSILLSIILRTQFMVAYCNH